ncbi:amidohydrolase family protein [Pedobacter sp. MC2016-14]|uniref:amidohydrolase family protein n=1 Tax=Pedobacter sp. MC2016-14 TaxID=2897327 RepID=UPI001E3B05C8|nr:amidohydrolase family protein [Pedobacter sp. MC2016-14]MCD0486774.1 amidohydrolase family protein [Pedobacter sp. MC2016-14]
MKFISAPMVYPVNQPALPFGVLKVTNDGTIKEVLTSEEALKRKIKNIVLYDGVLVPGMVNTHCHIELSHLKNAIPEKTGLVGFITAVMTLPKATEDRKIEAMFAAEREMYENGIVAVGDISNLVISYILKERSKLLYYHTFIEVLGLNPDAAKTLFENYKAYQPYFKSSKTSLTPHAAYSVSKELFELIEEYADQRGDILSMHNQESEDENAYFENRASAFSQFYERMGINPETRKMQGKSSLKTVLPWLSPFQKTLLVHNTFTSAADVAFAVARHPSLYWCLCPNANLYIEDRLPDVEMLRDAGLRITLGTDSLASNHQLSILEEMKTLQEHKAIGFDDLLKWATINGAEFLGIEGRYGSFEVGKRPGINLVEHMADGIITDKVTIKKLF